MAEANGEPRPEELIRRALTDMLSLFDLLPHEDSDDTITISVARGETTATSIRLPLAQARDFADVISRGTYEVGMAYNAKENFGKIVALIVEHRQSGGEVALLLAEAFRVYRTLPMGSGSDPFGGPGSLLSHIAAHLRSRQEPVNDRPTKLAELLTHKHRAGSLEDRLGRALRAAANEVGGVEALLGDSPSAEQLSRFMEETGKYRSGHSEGPTPAV